MGAGLLARVMPRMIDYRLSRRRSAAEGHGCRRAARRFCTGGSRTRSLGHSASMVAASCRRSCSTSRRNDRAQTCAQSVTGVNGGRRPRDSGASKPVSPLPTAPDMRPSPDLDWVRMSPRDPIASVRKKSSLTARAREDTRYRTYHNKCCVPSRTVRSINPLTRPK